MIGKMTGAQRTAAGLLAVLGLIVALAGCGRATPRADPTWVPQQTIPPVPLPTPVPEGGGSGSDPGQSTPGSGNSGSQSRQDAAVVASKLSAPTGLAVLPDGSALVGERSTGRILQVQPQPGKAVRLVRTLTGLSSVGGGGLLDLALSPSYGEDGLILALLTTKTDTRVVHFTAAGPVTPILTGIPRGRSDNVGRLFVLGNDILVGTGDAGKAANAAKAGSRGGKILRVDELGHPAPGNPSPHSVVYTSGHHTVNGLCYDVTHHALLETEDGSSIELNKIIAGHAYGWPAGDQDGPVATIPDGPGVGGCGVVGNTIYVGSLGGRALLRATIDPTTGAVGAFTPYINGKYGRLLTVVAAPDGSLWITTSNKDGHGTPVAADERVLHISPAGGGGGTPPA